MCSQTPPLTRIISQINPVQVLPSYFFKICFVLLSQLYLSVQDFGGETLTYGESPQSIGYNICPLDLNYLQLQVKQNLVQNIVVTSGASCNFHSEDLHNVYTTTSYCVRSKITLLWLRECKSRGAMILPNVTNSSSSDTVLDPRRHESLKLFK